jgi:hypothetical protein
MQNSKNITITKGSKTLNKNQFNYSNNPEEVSLAKLISLQKLYLKMVRLKIENLKLEEENRILRDENLMYSLQRFSKNCCN